MSTISGGRLASATGCYTFIGGGYCNLASGAYSSAIGCGLTASAACTFYANNICVCGTLTATVKSFVIPHPSQKGKTLQYGVL